LGCRTSSLKSFTLLVTGARLWQIALACPKLSTGFEITILRRKPLLPGGTVGEPLSE
jgi:hypothetical protein